MNGIESDNQGTSISATLLDVFVLSWITPVRAADRSTRLSLPVSYLVHVLSGLATVAVIILFVAIDDAGSRPVVESYVSILREIVSEWRRNPVEISLVVFFVSLAIELGFINNALGTSPWGARDEPFRRSFRHALHQGWLRTPHAFVIVAVMGSAITATVITSKKYQPPPVPKELLPTQPTAPVFSGDQAAHSKALTQYGSDLATYRRDLHRTRQEWYLANSPQRPWYAEDPEILLVPLGALLACWFIWAYLRAVGVERDVPPIERPPTCEACGYNLTGMTMEGRCPECGKPVVESLGEEVRPGPPWRWRAGSGGSAIWVSTAVQSVFQPTKLGLRLRVTSHETAHRYFIVPVLPLTFLLGFLGFLTFVTIETGDILTPDPASAIAAAFAFGTACALGTIGFALNTSMLVGLGLSKKYGRNLLPASMQAACFLSGYLVAWAAFGAVSMIAVMMLDGARFFDAIEDLTGMYRDFLAAMCWLIPNGIGAIIYYVLVARASTAARYANN